MAGPIATAAVQIVPSFKGIHKTTKQALGGLDPEFDKAGKRGGGALSRGVGKIAKAGLVAGGAALAAGLGTALAKGFSRLTAIDEAEAKLRGLGHSAENVESIMSSALTSVKGTAFGLGEAAGAAATLAASGVATGEDMTNALTLVADAATIAGTDMNDMGALFAKVAAKGKLDGQVMNQLLERQIGILPALAKHYGVSTEEAQKMVSAGKVSFEDFAEVMQDTLGGAAQASGETFTGAWKNVGAALGRIGETLLKPFFDAAKGGMAGLTAVLDGINDALKPVMAAFGEWLGSIDWAKVGQQMGAIFTPLWDALKPLLPALLEAWSNLSPIGVLLQALAPVAGEVASAIGSVAGVLAGALAQGLGFVLPILAELATTIAGVLTNGITAALPVITTLANMVGPILAVAFRTLAPIVLAVADVVMDLMKALMPVASIIMGLVASILPPLMNLFMALAPILVVVGELIGFLARVVGAILVAAIKVLVPIIQVLAQILAVVLVAAIKVVTAILNVIIGVVKAVGAIFTWLWKNAVMPAWNAIRAAIDVSWKIIRPIFSAIVTFIKLSLMVAFKLFEVLVKAVWLAVRVAIDAAWKFIKRWVFDPIVAFLKSTLGPAFTWLRDNVVKPVWEGIKSAIDTVWRFIRDKVFDPLKNAVEKTLPKAFETGKDAIGKAWDKLKGVAKKPVKFVVDTVINDGVIGGFNKIASTFKMNEIKKVQLPKGFRTGGHVWGAGTETSDSIPAMLSHNEHVLTAKDVRNLGGHDSVYRLRAMAARGLVPGFAKGGAVWQNLWGLVKQQFPWARLTSSYRPGSITASGNRSYHSRGMAVDLAGRGSMNSSDMMQIFNWIRSNFGQSSEIIYSPAGGRQVKNGRNHYYTGAVRRMHFNHVHWANQRAFGGPTAGVAGGDGFDLGGFLNPFKGLFDKITSGIQNAGAWGDLVAGGAKKIVQMPIDWITDNASKFLDVVGDQFTNVKDIVTAGTGRARGRAWALGQGWPLNGARWKALDYIVTRESSWNPNAKNPRSSASGLGQFIDANARHYLGSAPMRKHPFDKQLAATVKYTHDRYGGLVPAQKYWKRHKHYADGGAVRMPWASTYTGPTKYDNGGWLMPGVQATVNATKKPEAVFTAEQFNIIKAAALGNASSYSGPPIQFGDVHGYSVDEVADQVVTKIRRDEAVRGRALL